MAEFNTLVFEQDGPLLTVTINRPEALNAINTEVMDELGRLFKDELPEREGIRGIILTGAGEKAFVAGADIKEFVGLSGTEGRNMAEKGQRIFAAIENSQIPVVAVIKGYALGAGCELAMACHLRIAGPKARFGQPEVNLGLLPGYGGTQRLVDLIGETKALELLLTADMIGAEEAHRLGLVNHVTEAGGEMAKAVELLRKIAQKAPVAVGSVIESVNAGNDPTADGYAAEVHYFGKCCNTEDFREGAAAFVEKRTPNFTGR